MDVIFKLASFCKQHCLYFLPDLQGHISLRPTLGVGQTYGWRLNLYSLRGLVGNLGSFCILDFAAGLGSF